MKDIVSTEFEDEFPDEHSHTPQEIDEGLLGVFVTDDEGRHYLLQHRTTDEGIIIDIYDRYGKECQATFARTWDELANLVWSLDPMMPKLQATFAKPSIFDA